MNETSFVFLILIVISLIGISYTLISQRLAHHR
jgi:hypothetical protein